MPIAASQDSRTHLQVATSADEEAFTWDFSRSHASTEATCMPVTHAYAPTDTECPSPSGIRRVYRRVLLEEVISPRLRTERGRSTFTRRWYNVPENGTDEETAGHLLAELESDDEAIAEITSWADKYVPPSPGRSLPLPAPEPTTGRWQSATLWVAGVLADPAVVTHPRIKRIGRQHLPMLLRAIASFADWTTGRSVTASNRTIGRTAASLCAEHIEQGRAWSGRRTDRLSVVTLAGHVSALTTALEDAGWLVERARGRHLTRLESAVAWLRHHVHQDRAGSVRDLVVPDGAWVTETTMPAQPAWAEASNPFFLRLRLADLWTTLTKLCSHNALHTHQCEALLVLLVILERWLLTHKNSEEPSPKKKKRSRPPLPSPSGAAQKLGAALVQRMPWLLRHPQRGKRRHCRSLARILDAEQVTDLTAAEIITHIEHTLRENRWEIHPQTIREPLGWLRTVLRNGWSQTEGHSAHPDGAGSR